jgi:hypothetical protein
LLSSIAAAIQKVSARIQKDDRLWHDEALPSVAPPQIAPIPWK